MSRFGWLVLAAAVAVGGTADRLTAQVSPGPLARAHRTLEGTLKCTNCHGGGSDGMAAKCVACHREIGWLAERGRGIHGSRTTKAATCASCHPDHAGAAFDLIKWPDGSAEQFDHRRAGWTLEQTHKTTKCADCHAASKRVSPAARLAPGGNANWTGLEQTCASCHEDIHRGALGARCTSCHDPGRWEVTPGFAHDTTDYPLTGRHAKVSCDDCHLSPRLPLKRDVGGRPVPIYQPVPHQACTTCHQDVHQGQFGANCAGCHSAAGFAQISGGRFDHGRTAFLLVGKHDAVPCADCHKDFSTDAGRKPASATCATCHAPDPHGGTATVGGKPADCATCHSERGFFPSTFPLERHQESRYPLEGKHAAVGCAACHRKNPSPAAARTLGSSAVILRPVFGQCSSCHADQHGGQLATWPSKGECGDCHAVAGWTPSGFGQAEHAKLKLPLEGRHAEVACAACHGADRKGLGALPRPTELGKAGFVFRGINPDCATCHLDPHGGRFEPGGASPVQGGCQACHDARAFRPAAVDLVSHERFGFALRGAHRATPCSGCHQELATPRPVAIPSTLIAGGDRLRASPFQTDSTCAGCHQLIHGNQFANRKDGGRCDGCHGDDSFIPAARFDHDRDATFALGTGHKAVPCASCHKTTVGVGGVKRTSYRPLSGKCESCHAAKPGPR